MFIGLLNVCVERVYSKKNPPIKTEEAESVFSSTD